MKSSCDIIKYMYVSLSNNINIVVVMVLPDPFRRMGAWRNSTESQQSGHGLDTPRSGPEVKNEKSSAKDGAPEKLRRGTIQVEMSQILQRVSAGAARRNLLPFNPA